MNSFLKIVPVPLMLALSLTGKALAQSNNAYNELLKHKICEDCNLSNLDLSGLDLSGANLKGANLSNADLSQTNLTGADLSGTVLYLTNFNQSNLAQANISYSNLKGSDFTAADLTQVNLTNSVASYAIFNQANLSQSNLNNSDFRDAQFIESNLAQAQFENTNLAYSDMTDAKLPPELRKTLQSKNMAVAKSGRANAESINANKGPNVVKKVVNTHQQANRDSADALNLASGPPQDTLGISQSITTKESLSSAHLLQKTAVQKSSTSQIFDSDQILAQISTDSSEIAQVAQNNSQEIDKSQEIEVDAETNQAFSNLSPLSDNLFPQPTANHLKRGDVVLGLINRAFFLPNPVAQDGTAAYPTVNIDWGITNTTEIGFSLQIVDTGSPDVQGPFTTIRREENRDYTLEVKQQIWKNDKETLALSGVAALAAGDRTYEFVPLPEVTNGGVIPSLQLPLTATLDKKLNVTLAPTLAFFPSEHALFLRRPPIANPGSFGTNVGLTGAISYQVHPRLSLWGDAFIPFTGNNSLNRTTGLPAKSIAFNVGARYLVNPRLGLDVFASNTFGNRGPLALTADRNFTAFGAGLTFLPSLISSNRKYADSFRRQYNGKDTPLTVDGIGFFDGGTVPNGKFLASIQGGQQGILSSLRYGVLKDFEASIFLDYVLGTTDESEQGFGLKLRLLNQEEKAPFTASAAVTFGQTNEPFANFFDNNVNEFNNRGLNKTVPFAARVDNDFARRLFLVSASLPLHYKANDKLNFWFTPSIGYVQRKGIELAGFNIGSSVEVIPDFSLVAEVGANFAGNGNSLGATQLVNRIPWTFAVRWNPSSVFGINSDKSLAHPSVELYVTNRSGSSIWNQMRVRSGNDPAVGVGLSIPF